MSRVLETKSENRGRSGDLVFRGWMYDLAREQSPTEAQLDRILERSLSSGSSDMRPWQESMSDSASVGWSDIK